MDGLCHCPSFVSPNDKHLPYSGKILMFHSEDHVMFAGNNSKLYDSHSAV